MKTTQVVYAYLLTQLKPVDYANVAEALKLNDRATRSALHNLIKNPAVAITEVKYPGKRGDKKLNTYLLAERKPLGKVFKTPSRSIILQILSKVTKPVSHEKITELSRGKLTLEQVRMAVIEFVKHDSNKIIKTKVGHIVYLRLAAQKATGGDKDKTVPHMNPVDLLFAGRCSQAVLKHDSIVGL